MDRIESVVQLLTVILIFIFVLVLTYLATKFTASFQKSKMSGANVEILETVKIAPTKYIQIVRIGEKYFSYVVCKDTVTLLGELSRDDISVPEKGGSVVNNISFKDILEKLKKQ